MKAGDFLQRIKGTGLSEGSPTDMAPCMEAAHWESQPRDLPSPHPTQDWCYWLLPRVSRPSRSPVPRLGDEPPASLHLHVQTSLHAAHLHVFVQVPVHVVLGCGQLQLQKGDGAEISPGRCRAGGRARSSREKPAPPISHPSVTPSSSHLYLVDGFLVLLLTALEQRLCVLDHLLQAVILLLGRAESMFRGRQVSSVMNQGKETEIRERTGSSGQKKKIHERYSQGDREDMNQSCQHMAERPETCHTGQQTHQPRKKAQQSQKLWRTQLLP